MRVDRLRLVLLRNGTWESRFPTARQVTRLRLERISSMAGLKARVLGDRNKTAATVPTISSTRRSLLLGLRPQQYIIRKNNPRADHSTSERLFSSAHEFARNDSYYTVRATNQIDALPSSNIVIA